MKIFGWDVTAYADKSHGGNGWIRCDALRYAGFKALSFYVAVPWMFCAEIVLWRDSPEQTPTVVVDVDLAVEVPASLGDKAPYAVLDAMVKMVELRRWRCAGGVSAHLSEDDDEWSS